MPRAMALDRPWQLHAQQHADLACEVAGDAGMHLALLVEEAAARLDGERALVPDVGVEVDAEAAVRPEGDEVLGFHVVARRRRPHDERLAVDRPEELSAIGIVAALP